MPFCVYNFSFFSIAPVSLLERPHFPPGITGASTGGPIGVCTGAPTGVPTGATTGAPNGTPVGVSTGAPNGAPTGACTRAPTGVSSGKHQEFNYH